MRSPLTVFTLGLLALLAACQSTAPVPPGHAAVHLLAGQSNMQGIGKLDALPADWLDPLPDVWFWNGESFEVLDPRTTRLSTRAGEFGPELGYAHGLRKAGIDGPLYLVKFHRSGQPLHPGWDGNTWVGSPPGLGRRNFHPGDAPGDPHVGRHYRDWLAQVRAALDALRAEGLEPAIQGVVWMQGEQDSKHVESATTYAAHLRHLRTRLGGDLDAPELPWVYGQVLPHEPAKDRFTHREQIREQMAALDADSGRPEATPGMRMVPTEDMPLLPDTVHYDAEGQRRLGLAFAAAWAGVGRSGTRVLRPYGRRA